MSGTHSVWRVGTSSADRTKGRTSGFACYLCSAYGNHGCWYWRRGSPAAVAEEKQRAKDKSEGNEEGQCGLKRGGRCGIQSHGYKVGLARSEGVAVRT